MIDDPYKILGVSPTASDDEIKRAYRKLAKQYHPDLNPGDEAAAQKMQQINAAYEQIKNPEKNSSQTGYGGYGNYGYGYGGYGSYGYGYGSSSAHRNTADQYQQAAYQYIRFGRYQEALNVLNSCTEKNARWYYLSAVANHGLGNHVTALEHIRKAVSMDPANATYLQTLEAMENGGFTYRQQAGSYRGYSGSGLCHPICMCYFLQLFCCGGRGYFCC